MRTAWGYLDRFHRDHRVVSVREPEGLTRAFRDLTMFDQRSPKLWNDAYLAGFARSGNMTLVSFDKGFHRWPELKLLILEN